MGFHDGKKSIRISKGSLALFDIIGENHASPFITFMIQTSDQKSKILFNNLFDLGVYGNANDNCSKCRMG